MQMPVVFVSHGAPTFAIEPGRAGPLLRAIGERVRRMPGLRAVLVISPHWHTRGLRIGSSHRPETIHDFGGFPRELYALSYPSPGSPDVADEVRATLEQAGVTAQLAPSQGLDHGAWVPMMYLIPDASVPVLQLSLPLEFDAAQVLALGRALAPLREQGVLIVASGGLTHNLYEFRGAGQAAAPDYVNDFVQWARQAVTRHDDEALVDFHSAPHSGRAHPSDEHFLPLLVAAGASSHDEPVEVIDGGVTYGVLSMEGYVFGQLPALAGSEQPAMEAA